jgi:hypothetical protein
MEGVDELRFWVNKELVEWLLENKGASCVRVLTDQGADSVSKYGIELKGERQCA